MSSPGQYVTIPAGSNYYIYGDGDTISGWTHAEFAALIGSVPTHLTYTPTQPIKPAFTTHFGGWDNSYDGGITPPEHAEIFCQCVDSRIDALTLTDELHAAVTDWANNFDAFRTCTYCNTEFRPHIYNDDTKYLCDSDTTDCTLHAEADRCEVPLDELKQAKQHDSLDDEWNHIVTHSPLDLDPT